MQAENLGPTSETIFFLNNVTTINVIELRFYREMKIFVSSLSCIPRAQSYILEFYQLVNPNSYPYL